MVIDKAGAIGDHGISGAVLDPRSMTELFGDFLAAGCPVEGPVTTDAFLARSRQFWAYIKAPITPPMMNNHGNYVASLNKIVKWMAEKAEALGVQVFPEFPGQELLYDGDKVIGARIGDKGVDKNGQPKPNFEPGPDLMAKVTVLGEGPRGTLAKQLQRKARHNVRARTRRHIRSGSKSCGRCPPVLDAGRSGHPHRRISARQRHLWRRLHLFDGGRHLGRRLRRRARLLPQSAARSRTPNFKNSRRILGVSGKTARGRPR